MGRGSSMSPLTSAMAFSWSSVSTNPNADSISVCQGVSGPNALPSTARRRRYSSTSSAATSLAAARALARVRCQSAPPILESVGDSPPL